MLHKEVLGSFINLTASISFYFLGQSYRLYAEIPDATSWDIGEMQFYLDKECTHVIGIRREYMLEGNSLAKLFKYEYQSEYGIHNAFDKDINTIWTGRPLTKDQSIFIIGVVNLIYDVRCIRFYESGDTLSSMDTNNMQVRIGGDEWTTITPAEYTRSGRWTTIILRKCLPTCSEINHIF